MTTKKKREKNTPIIIGKPIPKWLERKYAFLSIARQFGFSELQAEFLQMVCLDLPKSLTPKI